MKPYLLFEFNEQQTNNYKPIQFSNPIDILETDQIEDIPLIFEKVDQALKDGYYVAGYVSYEAAPAFDSNFKVHQSPTLPLVWFGISQEPTHLDEKSVQSHTNQSYHVSDWKLSSNFQQYQNGIDAIKQAIEQGNTYQVNYTARLHTQFTGCDRTFFNQLAKNQSASYSAYLNIGRYQILSASPELFFKVKANKITTKPMKGTAKRGRYFSEDQALKKQLSETEKEQAENLMIVDLLRNDIGKIAQPGSVRANKLFEIETYPTVHQMTSTIEADLDDDTTVFDWFQALFPCGSITGAPKISTMDYIAQLEQTPRDVYCGAIGFITPKREAIFNVPIRTVVIDSVNETATYGVGGGITWDSTVDGEYNEMMTKAKLLTENRPEFQLLESLKLVDGVYPLLHHHLERLNQSANYFGFDVDPITVKKTLRKLAVAQSKGLYKVRLLVNKYGDVSVEETPLQTITGPITCRLARTPVNKNDPFLYHKTTNRAIHQLHELEKSPDEFSVLLWNEAHELTEFTIGNLVVEKNGKYYTPPIESGLLAGTLRQTLIDDQRIEERVISKDELETFDKIWFVNSVRGWLSVELNV